MSNAIHILKKSLESLKSEAISVDMEIDSLQAKLKERHGQLNSVMKRIQEINEAISTLEKPNVAGKDKKAKR